MTSSASDEEPTSLATHVEAAEASTQRIPLLTDPEERALEAFRGHQAWIRAYEVGADASALCAARSLLLTIVEDAEIDAPIREDAKGWLATLEAKPETPACDEPPEAIEPSPISEVIEVIEAKEVPKAVLLPPRSAEGAPPRGNNTDPSDDPPDVSRALRIAGGIGLGAGAALLGTMTYGLVVDARSAAQIREFDGLVLTDADLATIQALGDRGRRGAQLATLAGVSAGLTIVSGAVLVLVGHKRSRARRVAISPGAGHITLRGRF